MTLSERIKPSAKRDMRIEMGLKKTVEFDKVRVKENPFGWI